MPPQCTCIVYGDKPSLINVPEGSPVVFNTNASRLATGTTAVSSIGPCLGHRHPWGRCPSSPSSLPADSLHSSSATGSRRRYSAPQAHSRAAVRHSARASFSLGAAHSRAPIRVRQWILPAPSVEEDPFTVGTALDALGIELYPFPRPTGSRRRSTPSCVDALVRFPSRSLVRIRSAVTCELVDMVHGLGMESDTPG